MSLIRFNVIVAVDALGGMAKDGGMPWRSEDDMKFFRDTTTGGGRCKNVVIMGRGTYESLPPEARPLANRKNVVISSVMRQEDFQDILIYRSLPDALKGLGQSEKMYEEVYVCGGERIYDEAMTQYSYLVKRIHLTQFKSDYKCDKSINLEHLRSRFEITSETKTRDFTRYIYEPKLTSTALISKNLNTATTSTLHDEYSYLSYLRYILDNGEKKSDRTGKGTLSVFGHALMKFDISTSIPLLTTKEMRFETIVKELLFFISGQTDTKILEKQGVNIWKLNTTKEFIASRGLSYNVGDMGPMYGYQWRYWGLPYEGCENVPKRGMCPRTPAKGEGSTTLLENQDESGGTGVNPPSGIDQLANLIEGLRNEPHSRRHVISAWNVSQLDQGVLPPCHSFVQFNVSGDKKYLDCMLTQRSGDMFLGVPFNIASYSILTYMIAHITGLSPRYFIHSIGDAHIYLNHTQQVTTQLKRTPYPFPSLSFRGATTINSIDDFTLNNFILERYNSWPSIYAELN